MEKDLNVLLIKECCIGNSCEHCGFRGSYSHCYLSDIIDIIKRSEENEK